MATEAHHDATPVTRRSVANGQRPGDRLFWGVVAASGALTVLTLIASQFVAGPPGVPPGARLLPRVQRAPANTGELLRTLGVGSLIWYACFVSAPLFVWLSRRLPFDRGRRATSVAVHLIVIVLLAALTAWLQYLVTYRSELTGPPLGGYIRIGIIAGTLPFVTVAAAAHALEARARAQERELDAQRMRSQLAESRLEALTAQLQPHFLFNTLQGISTLISRDPVAADKMLTSLSDLLREVLRRGERREVELTEELRVLESYLDISRTRFGERLSIVVSTDEVAGHALVPFFILQPLVENALHHGISSHAGAGSIEIGARREGDRLLITVDDDGPGIVAPDAQRGIGLANTRARLDELYGRAQSLELGRPTSGGFRVTVTVPYRTRAAESRST
jgi:two-component system LytT family sensor kinase